MSDVHDFVTDEEVPFPEFELFRGHGIEIELLAIRACYGATGIPLDFQAKQEGCIERMVADHIVFGYIEVNLSDLQRRFVV